MIEQERANFPRPLSSVKEHDEHEMPISDDMMRKVRAGVENTAKFDALIENMFTSFAEVQSTVQDLLQLKDDLLLQYLPSALMFRLTVVVGKVFRAFSDLNTPVTEMIRLTRICTATWEKNTAVLKKVYDMYETKKQMLNVAIRRLALIDRKTKMLAREKRIMNWEKLFIKMNELKGHGRRWKFQMETFRNKSNQGYDELVRWAMREPAQIEDFENLTARKDGQDKNDSILSFNNRPSNMSANKKNSDDEDDVVEVDSNQDLFSDRSKNSFKNAKSRYEANEIADAEVQTYPNLDDKTTWTGEPEYSRYLIVRLFKPVELNAKKLKFKVSYDNKSFESKYFEPKVRAEKKPDPKNKLKKINPNPKAPVESKEDKTLDTSNYQDFLFEMKDYFKKKDEISTSNDNCIQFELNDQEREEHKITDAMAYSNVHIDDILTLDLPILYYEAVNDLDVIDYYDEDGKGKEKEKEKTDGAKTSRKKDTSNALLKINNLTAESSQMYSMLSKRSPFTFTIHKSEGVNKEEIGKLPLMFFWVRKPWLFKADKNTGTQTVKDIVADLTGVDIDKTSRAEIENLFRDMSLITRVEAASSPINFPQRPPSTPVGGVKKRITDAETAKTSDKKAKGDDKSQKTTHQGKNQQKHQEGSSQSQSSQASAEMVDAAKEKLAKMEVEMQTMQTQYQGQIEDLTFKLSRLENEIVQLKTHNEQLLKSGAASRAQFSRTNKFTPDPALKTAYVKPLEKPHTHGTKTSSKYNLGKDLPEDFLDRLKTFAERSEHHHKEIASKYVGEEAATIEKQMAVQHRLDSQTGGARGDKYEDFCLPAVFMPFKSPGNVYNPRAHRYFHPSGAHDVRLTQPPSVFQLPPLPSKPMVSVINLFELSKRYQDDSNEFFINDYINKAINKLNASNNNAENQGAPNELIDDLEDDNFVLNNSSNPTNDINSNIET